jgi:hypothetical protein
MYNGKLIGDLFDAVERAQSSVSRQRTKNESAAPLPEMLPVSESADSPMVQSGEHGVIDEIL